MDKAQTILDAEFVSVYYDGLEEGEARGHNEYNLMEVTSLTRESVEALRNEQGVISN